MLTLSQAIESRRSVRTFTDRQPDLDMLAGLISDPRLRLLPHSAVGSGKIGTYGVIKGSPAYVALLSTPQSPDKSDPSDKSDLSPTLKAGIIGERFVLECARHVLGTCWLGGTFSRADVRKAIPDLPDGSELLCLIAVGNPADKPRFIERIMRRTAGSDRRKPLSMLIIAGEMPPALAPAMEAVRLAPSAVNRQPWRFAFNRDGSIDVYGDRSDSFMTLDVGIALAHFLALAPQYAIAPPRHTHPTLAPLASLHLKK